MSFKIGLKTFLVFGFALQLAKTQAQVAGCQVAREYKALASIYYSAENLRSDTFDVLKTTINLEIGNSNNQQIKGNTQIRFAPKQNGKNFIRFDLLRLLIDSVKEGNALRTYSYNDTILKINFAAPKNTTDTSLFTIYYHGQPQVDATGWGGFYFDNTQGAEYAYNLGVGFGAKPHNYGRTWFPCFDNFVERCKFEFNITSDTARRAYCNGQLMSDVVNATNTRRTRQWLLNEEIPTYLASVALANYSQVNWSVNTLTGTKPIVLAAFAADTTSLKNSFVNLKNCIAGFENYFGPYKWNRFGYCLVPFNSGAMEHATNISYPRAFIGNLTYEAELMAHELSHHWWGDLITCETQEDMWINEGMATYSGYLFLEWQYGKAKYLNALKTVHDDLLHFLHKKEGGFRAVSGVPHSLTYGDHVYKKGADIAHTLRGYMGDTDFFNGVKYMLQQNAYKHINSNDFRNLLQTSSGQSLNDFFANWVLSGGWSHFAIDSTRYEPTAAGVIAKVGIKQKLYGAPALHNNVPLEISFFKSDWSRQVIPVIMSGASAGFVATLSFTPVYCALNYDSKINDASSHEYKTIKTVGINNYALGKASLITSNTGADSSLIRIVHNYVRPDAFKSNPGNHKLSDQHYWKVEGILSTGYAGKIKFGYDGTKGQGGANTYLDTLLTLVNGDSIGLFYRKDARDDWHWLRQVSKVINNAKIGSITTDSLRLGEYTFANIADTTYLNLMKAHEKRPEVKVYPNPGKQVMQVELEEKPAGVLTYHITDLLGRNVLNGELRNKKSELNLNLLTIGTYVLEIKDNGALVHSQKIILN